MLDHDDMVLLILYISDIKTVVCIISRECAATVLFFITFVYTDSTPFGGHQILLWSATQQHNNVRPKFIMIAQEIHKIT